MFSAGFQVFIGGPHAFFECVGHQCLPASLPPTRVPACPHHPRPSLHAFPKPSTSLLPQPLPILPASQTPAVPPSAHSAGAAITKYQIGGLEQQTLVFSQFWKLESPKSQFQQGLVSGEKCLLGLPTAAFLWLRERMRKCSFSYHEATNPIRPELHPYDLINLNCLLKALPQHSHTGA